MDFFIILIAFVVFFVLFRNRISEYFNKRKNYYPAILKPGDKMNVQTVEL